MAWEAISKEEVAKLSGVKTTDMRDEWYNMAVDMIARVARINNIGKSVTVQEYRDGNGARVMPVNRPPIVSVQSVYIDDVLVPAASVTFDSGAIYLQETDSDYDYDIDYYAKFARGARNITLNYTSGSTTIDHSVSLVIALIVKELANVTTGEGAEARLQFYRPGQSEATESPLIHWGIHGKIKGIIETMLGTKARIA